MDEEISNVIETLSNLIFLIEHEGNEKGMLTMYTKLASETIQNLTRALAKARYSFVPLDDKGDRRN